MQGVVVDGVDLLVLPDAEHLGPGLHERTVILTPVPVELFGAQVGTPAETERELDHLSESRTSSSPTSVLFHCSDITCDATKGGRPAGGSPSLLV